MTNKKYFAIESPDVLANDLLRRARTFYQRGQTNGYLLNLRKMWCAYYGVNPNYLGHNQHEIKFTGEQGELAYIIVNHFRNLAQHIYTMITASRPIMDAQAINTDYKSLTQTTLANGILQYYMRQKKLEDFINKATEMSIVLASSYIKLAWDEKGGSIYDVDENSASKIYEGDVEFSLHSPFDVVFDGTKETFDYDWILVRSFKNKYSLMAKYPELAERIESIPTKSDYSIYRFSLFSNDETDDVPVFEFFHKKTEAVPDGRYLLFLGEECVLLDSILPYRQVPIFRIAPNEIMGSPYGYSPLFDIFPIQEAINMLYSTILSNQQAFGVQNVFIKRGSDLAISSIPGGLNLMEGNEKPEPVNLTATAPEVFEFLNLMIKGAETISGVNSVARGFPESSLKSGTALALVQSMALQFVSGLQQSYIKLIEDVGTSLINILKDFSTRPKIVSIVGKNNKPYLKEFTGDDLSDVSRVMVTMGNPLSRSSAGRIQLAEQMMQMGIVKNPQEVFQVLNTGNLETMTEGPTSELLLIKKENEMLLEGRVPLVAPIDQHQQHISEHSTVLNDPDLRENPNLVKVVMDHIEMHMMALRQTDPELLAITGQQSLMPPPPLPEMPMEMQGNLAPTFEPQQGKADSGQKLVGPNGQGVTVPQPASVPKELKGQVPESPEDLVTQNTSPLIK